MNSGDVVELFDNDGSGYVGEVELHGSDVIIRIQNGIAPEKDPAGIILASALIKSAKFEWILQKATELGVREIFPLKTRFSEINIPDNKLLERLQRWNRILREASKQCRRFHPPKINEPLSFPGFLALQAIAECKKCLFYEKSSNYWQPDQLALSDRIVLCLGPEGGWDPGEIKLAEAAGFQISSLGPLTLRAETAAIAAISIIQHQIQIKKVSGSQFPVSS
jgi:16S rRNA (uracil1498-N3)-methyltransferase